MRRAHLRPRSLRSCPDLLVRSLVYLHGSRRRLQRLVTAGLFLHLTRRRSPPRPAARWHVTPIVGARAARRKAPLAALLGKHPRDLLDEQECVILRLNGESAKVLLHGTLKEAPYVL